MKKRRLACLAFAAPLLAVTACTNATGGLSITANWFLNTGNASITDANETLVYAVTFEASEGNGFLTYEDGTYTMRLSAENRTLADGSTQETCYRLHTELAITAVYTVNGETERCADSVVSDVWFRDTRYSLQPVLSEKTVVAHSPYSESPASLRGAYTVYSYRYTASYDAACANADVTLEGSATRYSAADGEDRSETLSSQSSVELTGSGTYFDNEQILFALRGVSMTSAASFRSVNPVTRAVQTLSMAETPSSASETVTFAVNGESAAREMTTYTFSLGYGGNNPGMSQTLVYAGVTDANSNAYRSALVRMDVPILHSLGTMHYVLTQANW